MAAARILVAGWAASVLVAGALPTPAHAASPTRIDPFDHRGNRAGSAVVEGDRVGRVNDLPEEGGVPYGSTALLRPR